ncbi:MAG: amidohydrolase [Nitriliruptoraceae bacterium]|nr:amidohydrolase [Nitriliruptoraceae bacterium]
MSDPERRSSMAIRGCDVLVRVTPDDVEVARDRTILVRDGAIEAIVPSGAAATPAVDEVIDASGTLAVPGLINTHTHAPMVLLRGAAEDVTIEDWFNRLIWPMETNLTPALVRLGAQLACAEMLAAGVTTFVDHYFAMDEVADVVVATGIRADLGSAFFGSDGPAGLERSLDFARRRRGDGDGRVTTSLAPHATYTVDDDLLTATAEAARTDGLRIHVHAAESMDQTRASIEQHGITPIEVLARTGVLDAGALIAHGTGITPADLPRLAAVADRVGVATSPKGYLKAAWSTTPIRGLREAGVPVGLATDGAAIHNTLDVWESVRLTALIQKDHEHDPTWLTRHQALHHATVQSAAAIGQAGRLGVLEPGARADLALIDLQAAHLRPIHDHAAMLVHSVRASDVTTTIVDGRVVYRDRRLTTIDLPALLEEVDREVGALLDVSHGTRIQTYDH